MLSLPRKVRRVHGLLGCNLPKPPRTFAEGLLETEAPKSGPDFWTDELTHLESLLDGASPARAAYLRRRIDGVLGMLDPDRERLERQREAAYQLGLMVDAIARGRQDGSGWEEQESCRLGR